MKKYGVRVNTDNSKFSAYNVWNHCKDKDGYFGSDDINEAYQFAAHFNLPIVEVFEKTNK